ncbi:hypothetical protein QDR37_14270 [Amnibacterium sp. CER49]|uniref:hypothetical protein n=1 Tax=Amnibacterium sp. CER49 TaxID=3039161 RepID=UPI002449D096|nr:hypothetical protein [Amnibacterium sp. CER49]MDH2445115.1 hypothetical protein [Amnibacterium sp. CER49]
MDDPTGLSEDQMLTYFIGDIARDDAWCEGEARQLWSTLTRYASEVPAEPNTYEAVLRSCRDLLGRAPLDESIRSICRRALDEASDAHGLRNLLTHDIWMRQGLQGENWVSLKARTSMKNLKPVRPIGDFEKCRTRLARLIMRLRALYLILPEWFGEGSDILDEARAYWTAIAMGNFKDGEGRYVPTLVDLPTVRVVRRPWDA